MALRAKAAESGRGRQGVATPAAVCRCLPLLSLLVSTPPIHSAQAQEATQPTTTRPWFASVSHYGRWVALGAAGGLLAQGALRHRDANQAFDDLIDRCRTTPLFCNKTPDGRYENPESEAAYQRSVTLDQRARAWLVAGQASLLLAGTMFLLDLVYGDDDPENIPFTPFEVYAQPGRLGLTARF